MDDVERKRAGAAVRDRIVARDWTIVGVSQRAGVTARTVSALISGQRWPIAETRRRIECALEWPDGELIRQARGERPSLAAFTSEELLCELLQRESRKS